MKPYTIEYETVENTDKPPWLIIMETRTRLTTFVWQHSDANKHNKLATTKCKEMSENTSLKAERYFHLSKAGFRVRWN